MQFVSSNQEFPTEFTLTLGNTRIVNHWIWSNEGIEMATSTKLCAASKGAKSPQLLLTSRGTENLQHLKKKKQTQEFQNMKLLRNQALWCNGFVLLQLDGCCLCVFVVPKYSSPVLDSVLHLMLPCSLSAQGQENKSSNAPALPVQRDHVPTSQL